MAVNLSPIGNDAPFVDSSGNPLTGGLLYWYVSNSTTPQDTYTTSAGNVANANPVVLGSTGYPTVASAVVEIWLTAGVTYKAVLKTAAGVTLWTRDNISGINDTTVTINEWVSGPAPTYISSTSFSLVGDQTSTFNVGRRVKTTNSGGTIYSTILASTFGAVTTIVVANDAGVLDSGISAVSYGLISADNSSLPLGERLVPDFVDGRLTLTTALPVTTADVTAATSVYFTPYKGNRVSLFDGTKWVAFKFAELTLAVPATTSTMYDVFLKNTAGTIALAALAWTNDTTRATALTTQDGVLVKSGDTQSRYLGSFRTTGVSGQTEDSVAKRHLWNYYNRVTRPMSAVDTTDSWTYTTAAFRQANANTANQLDFVIGVSEDAVYANVTASVRNNQAAGTVDMAVGIGLDSTTVSSAVTVGSTVNVGVSVRSPIWANYRGFPGVGRHYLAWLEYSDATGATLWFGDNGAPSRYQAGIMGELEG